MEDNKINDENIEEIENIKEYLKLKKIQEEDSLNRVLNEIYNEEKKGL